MAGVNLLHVPYRGGAPAIQTSSQEIATSCSATCRSSSARSRQEPDPDRLRLAAAIADVSRPALISQFLPGYTVVNWFAVLSSRPAGRLHRAVEQDAAGGRRQADVQKRFLENGMDTVIGSPAELKATIAADRRSGGGDPGSRDSRRLAMPLATTGQAACSTRSSIRRRRGVSAARRSCFITASAPVRRSGPGGFRRCKRRIAWSLSTCAAMAARTSLRPTSPVARPAGRRSVLPSPTRPACSDFISSVNRSAARSALAAALARPKRIATLTVSNGAHLGTSIQGVAAWRRQLDAGGVKAWSDAFLRDRFHDDALSPERRPGSPSSKRSGHPRRSSMH